MTACTGRDVRHITFTLGELNGGDSSTYRTQRGWVGRVRRPLLTWLAGWLNVALRPQKP